MEAILSADYSVQVGDTIVEDVTEQKVEDLAAAEEVDTDTNPLRRMHMSVKRPARLLQQPNPQTRTRARALLAD